MIIEPPIATALLDNVEGNVNRACPGLPTPLTFVACNRLRALTQLADAAPS